VSVNLAVWEGPSPISDEAAASMFEELYDRYVGSEDEYPPTERIAAYVNRLLDRYPDLTVLAEGDIDRSPWADGPLMADANGPFFYFGMTANESAEAAWSYAVSTARAMGLICFDPQAGTLAQPE
jgi:hypothetical protein